MSLEQVITTIAGGFESTATIAAELDKHDGLVDNAAELWKRIMALLHIPKDIAPEKTQRIRKAFSYALYGEQAESPKRDTGHANGRRRLVANALLRAKPLDFCNLAIALLAASVAGPPEVKDAQKALGESFKTQISRMQKETKEKLPITKPVDHEKIVKFVDDVGSAYEIITEDVDRHFDPKDVATISAKRFLLANALAPVPGTKLVDDGYYQVSDFESLLKERVGLQSGESLDPGAFVNEVEKNECAEELKKGVPFHETTYYPRYARVMHHILRSQGLKKMKEVVGDKTGAVHAIEGILLNYAGEEADAKELAEYVRILKQADISIVGHISPEALGWEAYEEVHYKQHGQGENVSLEMDPGLQKLLS